MSAALTPALATLSKQFAAWRGSVMDVSDMANWLSDHLAYPSQPDAEIEYAFVTALKYTIPDLLHENPNPLPSLFMSVYILPSETNTLDPAALDVLGLQFKCQAGRNDCYHMALPMAQWPALTAQLAWLSLTDGLTDVSVDERVYAEQLLLTYIPHHFPGVSYPTLQQMAWSNLLPVAADGVLCEDGLLHYLFQTRGGTTAPLGTAGVDLPDNLLE